MIFRAAFTVQSHDITSHTPDVFPVSVEEFPPTAVRGGRERDAQMSRGEQDGGADDCGDRIQRVYGCLQPVCWGSQSSSQDEAE